MPDTAGLGHNLPPVNAPSDAAVKSDLETRFPEVKAELEEMEEALKSFPEDIESEEDAKKLADNLGKISKLRKSWKAYRADEKKPWNTVIGIIQNFFTNGEDKLEGWDETWRPRLKKYQDKKEAEAAVARQRELDRQREETARLEREAAEHAMDALYAEALKENAEYDERKLRERLDLEAKEREAAEAAAEEARQREKAEAEAKRVKDREEKDRNTKGLSEAKAMMKMAEKRHDLCETDEATDDEAAMLVDMIRPGGTISVMMGPIATSLLLSEDQANDVNKIKGRLTELRTALDERSTKKERARREKERKAEEAIEKERAEDRMWAQAREELRLYDARKEREAADARVVAAREAEQTTKGGIRETLAAGKEALGTLKESERAAKSVGREAERGANRVDRMEKRNEDNTGDGRVRGDFSAVSSQTGRWTHNVMDEKALRKVCGPLGEHFTDDALKAAVFQWMVVHRDGFEGERTEDLTLPGVVFIWERGLAIRA